MGLYLDNGYFNVEWVLSRGMPINLVDGGRGTGKTYSTLKYALNTGKKFIFFRRTQTQCEIISRPEFSPFKPIVRDNPEIEIVIQPISSYIYGVYKSVINTDGKAVPDGEAIGMLGALSTFSNLRGFDASDVDLLIFDEYIPERQERPIKHEAAALLNAYETINRNRELQGRKALQMICLTNANDFACGLHIELNIVTKLEEMQAKGKRVSIMKDRGIGLYLLDDSPISELKRKTALYMASGNSDFSAMALDNKFAEYDTTLIKPQPLAEYTPYASCGEITVYKHKNARRYYVSVHRSGSPKVYQNTENGRRAFKKLVLPLILSYIHGDILFDSYMTEKLWRTYLDMC